jgi:hypothetical protein
MLLPHPGTATMLLPHPGPWNSDNVITSPWTLEQRQCYYLTLDPGTATMLLTPPGPWNSDNDESYLPLDHGPWTMLELLPPV